MKIVVFLIALALSLGLVACGGDDDGGGGGSSGQAAEREPLSESDYIRQLNRAQTDFASEARALDLSSPSSPTDFQGSLDELVGSIGTLIGELEGLEPPDAVTAQHDELVSSLQRYRALIRKRKDALGSSDQGKVTDAAQRIATGSNDFSSSFDATIDQINQRLN